MSPTIVIKQCSKCKQTKECYVFNRNSSWCKDCHKANATAWRRKKAAELKGQIRLIICTKCKEEKELYTPSLHYCKRCWFDIANKNGKRYQKEKREWYKNLKDNKLCIDCKQIWPSYILQYDHINSDKEYDISQMLRFSKERILKEIEKCELVCSNCHAERTHQRSKNEI